MNKDIHSNPYDHSAASKGPQTMIVKKWADVNGDHIADLVSLVGTSAGDRSGAFSKITLVIEDGLTKATYKYPLPFKNGYTPMLFLGDFNKDLISDILVNISTGGSGGLFWNALYSFRYNQLTSLFDIEKFNQGLQLQVIYREDYRVVVASSDRTQTVTLDVSNRKEYYTDIYSPNGKLRKPVNGQVLPLEIINPIDLNRDGTFSLLANQRIIGIANADTLGYVQSTWDWYGTSFRLRNYSVVLYPF
ncbi:VCBS repeat-containing protein [Heliobacillus mobilis]|uniref:VCBS repeat-containing protein n=1 Tax=Heliobacterium mobile TaxID=28064 RepID=A0A6I3SHE2_HELMO|nr:VCBS repeat-containing protein [Heliobacterium mobile]MTV48284.1 VCBS repeat-containing protein [Heliobacterium mobile]